MSISELRKDYTRQALREADMAADPIAQFRAWFDEALAAGLSEPNAMTLATATADGRPSARVVLLKGYDERGFVFYSNYTSRKGRELAENPWAALVFYWARLEGRTGQSLGSKALGITVVDAATGQPIGGGRAIGRFFARILSGFLCYLGYFWMLWDPQKQTWHDKLANSVVVKA